MLSILCNPSFHTELPSRHLQVGIWVEYVVIQNTCFSTLITILAIHKKINLQCLLLDDIFDRFMLLEFCQMDLPNLTYLHVNLSVNQNDI